MNKSTSSWVVALGLCACTEGTTDTAVSAVAAFNQPVLLTDVGSRQATVLTADLSADGWFDVLTLGAGESAQVNVSVPNEGLQAPQPVDGLPSSAPRQAQLIDLSADGRADLVLLDGEGQLRRFDCVAPTEFKEVPTGVHETSTVTAFALGDLDRNGWLDVVLALDAQGQPDAGADASAGTDFTTDGPLRAALVVWMGQADGSFARGPEVVVPTNSEMHQDRSLLTLSDVDSDGDLDVLVGSPQLGVGIVFNDLTEARSVNGNDGGAAADADSVDVTTDAGTSDVLADSAAAVGDAATPVTDAHITTLRFVAFEGQAPEQVSGFALVDFDLDGDLDWFQFSPDDATALFLNDGHGRFGNKSAARGLSAGALGCVEDLTNDALVDVVVIPGQPQFRLATAGLTGEYEPLDVFDTHGVESVSSVACADLDKDGDVDVLVASKQGSVLYSNRLDPLAKSDVNFYGFRIEGREGNPTAIGTKIYLTTGGHTQLREWSGSSQPGMAGSPAVHFGLRIVKTIDQVRVVWPDGDEAVDEGWEVNDVVLVRQSGSAD